MKPQVTGLYTVNFLILTLCINRLFFRNIRSHGSNKQGYYKFWFTK